MNKTRKILEQVKARIMADPSSYMQTTFCGTQCCIAGHIDVLVNGAEFHNGRAINQESFAAQIEEIEAVANEAIGEEESPWLFGTINTDGSENDPDEEQLEEYWPLDLSIEYRNATDSAGRAAIGCKAIDRYLQERGL